MSSANPVARTAARRTVPVRLGARSYDILIGRGLLDDVAATLAPVLSLMARGGAAAIVSDDKVAPLYAARLEMALAGCGLRTAQIVVPAGEPSKSCWTFEVWDKIPA